MSEISEAAIEQAAQCWCDEETSGIEMDIRLARAFAKRVDEKDRVIADLRRQLAEAKAREARLIDALNCILVGDNSLACNVVYDHIVSRGCSRTGFEEDSCECEHEYEWDCIDCPVARERSRNGG